jgi:superfamily I DNA and/or RNA helicase
VIAPYAAQVRLLRELLDVSGLEIDSVTPVPLFKE